MYCSDHLRVLVLSVAILLSGVVVAVAQNPRPQTNPKTDSTTTVHLRWGARPGVTRYRLQLSRDSAFSDIVFDRVVSGNDYQIDDLSPGRYYWRIASLTTRLGEFSSAAPIEVSQQAAQKNVGSQDTLLGNDSTTTKSTAASPVVSPTANPIIAGGGWRAAVGEITHPVLAHLRSPDKLDLVGVNSYGVVFALDSASGVALWSTGRKTPAAGAARVTPGSSAPLVLPSHSGVDNVVVLSGTDVIAIAGASGRGLWRATLPASISTGAVLSDSRSSEILVVDNSLQRIFILNENNGNVLAQVSLPHRVVGAPIALVGPGAARVMIAYDSGHVEIRDAAGAVVRSGDAGSPATTPPLYVRGRSGDLILVGTRAGLTALTAEDLRPLGMVAIKDDAPRGVLTAQDLDADGFPEVIMMTDRGHVVAVNATDGKTLWDATVGNETDTVAFADVNGDHVLDLMIAGGQAFALALSGRDGSVVWKDNESPMVVANHAASLPPRSVIAVPYGAGILLIAGDPAGTGLRAIEFPRGTVRPNP
jgi:outer membrane protein assembly factor BamB